MATGTTYTVHVQEFAKDRTTLKKGNYLLQVAKTVKDDKGVEDANVVYQSRDLAPNMTISWVEEYAVNWTVDKSKPGVKVTYGGNWEPAKLGESFSIDATGTFLKDANAQGNKNSVNISKNDYVDGVYMMLGLKDDKADEGYTPIYVSPNELLQQGSGSYTPIEKVQIWYEAQDLTGTGISKQRSYVEKYDMVTDHERYFWLPLQYGAEDKRGKWLNNEKRFPKPSDDDGSTPIRVMSVANGSSNAGDEDAITSDDVNVSAAGGNPIRVFYRVTFSKEVEKSIRIALGSYTAAKITQILRNVSNVKVEFKKENDGTHADATWDKPKEFALVDDADFAAEEAEDDKAAIDQALKDARTDGKMDKDETWSIGPGS